MSKGSTYQRMQEEQAMQAAANEPRNSDPLHLCGVVCKCNGDPLACGFPHGHDGQHSWQAINEITYALDAHGVRDVAQTGRPLNLLERVKLVTSAEVEAKFRMLLRRDAAWSKAIGSAIGYVVESAPGYDIEGGSVTPEHMRQLVVAKLSGTEKRMTEEDMIDRLASAGMDGATLIGIERARQCIEEGFTPERDDANTWEELAAAAACYALPANARQFSVFGVPKEWPWLREWWKPSPEDRVRELVKAGALIAAEIDRLRRAGVGA